MEPYGAMEGREWDHNGPITEALGSIRGMVCTLYDGLLPINPWGAYGHGAICY